MPIPPGSEPLLTLAQADLAQRLGLASAGDIKLVAAEARDWPDTSLGCPQEGFMYAQVITAGFQFTLEAGGERYEYHTDTNDTVILCETASAADQ